jgi:hypothetical protein
MGFGLDNWVSIPQQEQEIFLFSIEFRQVLRPTQPPSMGSGVPSKG